MKRFELLILFLLVTTNIGNSKNINFFFPDSLAQSDKILTWFSPNEYRKPIYLNGSWDYRTNKDEPWQKVVVPSGCDFQGEIIYRKIFTVDSSFYNHYFRLICYGINYYCNIFFNEKFIGSHAGGYSSFFIDVPPNYIKIGKSNIIKIKVDTRLDVKNTIPPKNQLLGQKNYGGIYREIYLLALPYLMIEIDKINHELAEGGSYAYIQALINVRRFGNKHKLQLQGYHVELRCSVELWELESSKPLLKTVIPVDEELRDIAAIEAELRLRKPKLWSPESPNLYILKVSLVDGKQIIDATSHLLGLKDLKITDGDLYLNGQRLILKGINWYAGNKTILQPLAMEQDIDNIKALNANAVRVVGHPPHPYWADLCDRKGLLLLEELPPYLLPWTRLNSDRYLIRMLDYLDEIILRDKLHVSILSWGLGNSYNFSSQGFVNNIYKSAKKLSQKPFYSNYDNTLEPEIAGIDVFDADKELLTARLPIWLEKNNQRVTIVTAFGSSLNERLVDTKNSIVLQQIQAFKIAEAWNILQQYKKIDGYFVNSFADWQCTYPLVKFGPRTEPTIFSSGLIDYDGNKRLAFNTVHSLYSKGRAKINPGVEFKIEHPGVFPLIGVISLLIFLFIYNSRRYFKENLKRIFIYPHGFYVDLRDGRKIPVSQTLIVAVLISLGLGLIATTFCYFYRENIFFDHLLTLLLMNSSLKQEIILLCWETELSVLIFSIIFFLWFFILAIFIKFFAFMFRKKLPMTQSFTLVYWVGANYLVLVPIGMVLYRILLFDSFFFPILMLLSLIILWFLVRLIKALKVIYIWNVAKTVLFILAIIIMIVGGVTYFYQQTQGILNYFSFYINYWSNF